MTTLRGILHVHSRFSYDGNHSLEEIASFGRRCGYGFICMSEHSDTLDSLSMQAHVAECARVSTAECVVIPGVEFSLGQGLHLLGFGMRRLTPAHDASVVARFILEEGGVAVVAHPARYHYAVSERLASLVSGIEVWNGAYDGRFVPDDRVLRLWRSLKARNPLLLGFGGPDLHRLTNHGHVVSSLACDAHTSDAVICALRDGRFAISNGCFALEARAIPTWGMITRIAVVRRCYEALRRTRDVVTARAPRRPR
jgi:hypothetical protein